MLECFQLLDPNDGQADYHLSLDYAQRQKSRARARSREGKEIAWFVPRGRVLADGDLLATGDGQRVRIEAAPERLSRLRCENPLQLARAAYHLGNRHVALEIDQGELHYQHDHVLDAMLEGLGLTVDCVDRPFHPEPGAYGQASHSHSHSHPRS